MTLKEFFEKAIRTGIENDPRGKNTVEKVLAKQKKKYESLKDSEKEFFDTETLWNPYADSRILFGEHDAVVDTVLAGIDIEVGEILLADSLNTKGRGINLLLSHHPEGSGIANLHNVMFMQSDILAQFGVPVNIAEALMEGRVREIERRIMPLNHTRAVDAARLIGIPFVCLHTPGDNMVVTYLQKLFDEKKPDTLGDILDMLSDIPEYREAKKNGTGPKLLLGAHDRSSGKIFVDMTGGTEGSKDIFESLSLSGVNTIVGMHLTEEHRKEAEKRHMNVIIAGHISSDNLGINLLLDAVLATEKASVLECSGFRRVPRG